MTLLARQRLWVLSVIARLTRPCLLQEIVKSTGVVIFCFPKANTPVRSCWHAVLIHTRFNTAWSSPRTTNNTALHWPG
jgi:hypothetical protein